MKNEIELTNFVPFNLPHFKIRRVYSLEDQLRITALSIREAVSCPKCGINSSSVHSYYTRQPKDLPVSDQAVQLYLEVRRFRCLNLVCPKQTFAERLPELLVPHAQRTNRLNHTIQTLAENLSANLAVPVLKVLKMAVSGDTLLRLAKRPTPIPKAKKPVKVIGVDDFAFRRGKNYGTIIINLETRRPIELLPDRTAPTLARWLKQQLNVAIVSRDRSTEYARGIAEGAPHVVQVADRWHLLKNWREVLERILGRFHHNLAEKLQASGRVRAGRGSGRRSLNERTASRAARERRLARYEKVKTLATEGLNILQIAEKMRMSRVTVRNYLASPTAPPPIERGRRGQILDSYLDYLKQRWADGCQNASQLWRELKEQGFAGSYKPVQMWASQEAKLPRRQLSQREQARTLAQGEPIETLPAPLPLTGIEPTLPPLPPPRRLSGLFLKPAFKLSAVEQEWLKVVETEPRLGPISKLNQQFVNMVRERRADALEDWLEGCRQSGLVDLETFAQGIERDYAAVVAGLSLPWSNGIVEGHVNRLKLIKRTMYGRASFELLRQKVLRAF
jgi:transposase